jgi:hypothetical protein
MLYGQKYRLLVERSAYKHLRSSRVVFGFNLENALNCEHQPRLEDIVSIRQRWLPFRLWLGPRARSSPSGGNSRPVMMLVELSF